MASSLVRVHLTRDENIRREKWHYSPGPSVEIELEITEKDKGKEIEVKAKAKCRNATPAAAINWISRLLFIISLARHDEQMLERGWEVRKT